jgi:hypothetical protein
MTIRRLRFGRHLAGPWLAWFWAWLCIGVLPTACLAGELAGVPNFQKVNDGVYRGAQPSELGFKNLAGLGIKTVLDLRLIGEHSGADEERAVKANAMRYVSVPMKGMHTPTNEQCPRYSRSWRMSPPGRFSSIADEAPTYRSRNCLLPNQS